MATSTTKTNKPINPRGNDQSPKGYNRAALYSGKALDFDGVNDEISIGSANFLGLGTGSFSFAWYINSTESADFQCVIDYRHTSGIGVLIDHRLGGIGGALQTAEGNFAFDVTSATSSVSGDVFDGKWHHVVFVADRSTSNTRVTFYIDGQLHYYDVNTNAQTSTIEDGQQMYFGGQGGTQYVDASLSSLKAFNVALTTAQVSDLYNNPEKIVPTGVADTALKLWLPMMEGAGTTAYDGSGNGNHGTISGATYVNGVGAPVAQSAVIDWNKGTNLLPESNGFVEADLNYAYTNSSETEATITAPDGSTDAFEYICDAVTTNNQFVRINPNTTYTSGQVYTYSLFVKYNTKQFVKLAYMNYAGSGTFAAAFDLVNGVVTDEYTQGGVTNGSSFIEEAPNGWYRIGISAALPSLSGQAMNFEFNVIPSGTPTWLTYGRVDQTTTTSDKVYIYGASLIEGEKGPYVHTIGTAQTSDVLLPQGLISGRDITGVNLFENVRKQGALNLDGNSWAEVHDNASLDITDAITLEAWVYWDGSISDKGILGRYVSATPGPLLYVNGSTSLLYFAATNININYTSMTTGWRHIVGTYNKVNSKLYVDGVLVNTGSQTDDINLSANPFAIGRYNNEISKSYPNDIAQPRIYNRALTAEEVERNYNAGKNTYKN